MGCIAYRSMIDANKAIYRAVWVAQACLDTSCPEGIATGGAAMLGTFADVRRTDVAQCSFAHVGMYVLHCSVAQLGIQLGIQLSIRRKLQTVYTNCIYKLYIHTVYTNCIYKLYVQTVYTNCIYKLYIQTVYTNSGCSSYAGS